MLSKWWFKAGKCETSVKLAVARIRLLKSSKHIEVKCIRRELAELLESGEEQTAGTQKLGKQINMLLSELLVNVLRKALKFFVERVIREEKTMSAYDLIELYCELIHSRLPIIESQKSCPIDLKEAVASVIFASPRCADIPELMDIRKHFTAKYGKEFINSALELHPNCGVSRLLLEKLYARTPDVETKIKVLTSIAEEHNVKWDSKAFEEQHQKPNYKLEKVGEKLSARAPDDETKVKTLTSIARGHDVNLDLKAFEELLRNKRHKLKKVGEKLSTRAPDVETKIKISTSVAQEHDVACDSKAFEEHLQRPNEDLLNGRKESSQNDAASKPAVSYTNSESSSTWVSFCSQPKAKASENIAGNIGRGYSGEENAS